VVLQVDVENAFNSVSCKAIFQKLHLVWSYLFLLFPFVYYIYA
jgi:hypothetical protein